MKVGDTDIKWDFGWQMASEILNAIQFLGTSESKGIKRIDGTGFKVYWAGSILRIDIDEKGLV